MSNGSDWEDLPAIYRSRFDERDLLNKRTLWEVLVRVVFQGYVPHGATVVDLGAGDVEIPSGNVKLAMSHVVFCTSCSNEPARGARCGRTTTSPIRSARPDALEAHEELLAFAVGVCSTDVL